MQEPPDATEVKSLALGDQLNGSCDKKQKKVVRLGDLEVGMSFTKQGSQGEGLVFKWKKMGSILKMSVFKLLKCQQNVHEQIYENFILDTSFSFIS